MVTLAWYVGFFGNILLYIILSISILYIFSQTWKKKTKEIQVNVNSGYIWALTTLLSFNLMIFTIVLLYLQTYLLRTDLLPSTTIWPTLMWLGNLLFFGSLYLSISLETSLNKKIVWFILLCYLIIGAINGLELNNYIVYWNDGNVLVFYHNKMSEAINSVLNISVTALTFYFAFVALFDKQSKNIAAIKNSRPKIAWLLLSIIIILFTFLIPRTESWSITDPVSVKIISYTFFYCFLISYLVAWIKPKKAAEILKNYLSNLYSVSKQKIFLSFYSNLENKTTFLAYFEIFSVIGILLSLFLAKFGYNFVKIYDYADEAVADGIAFFLGEFWGILWYIHLIGCLFPLLITIIILAINLYYSSTKYTLLKNIGVLTALQVILSYFFNNILNLGLSTHQIYSPFILGFIIPPVLLALYNIFFSSKLHLSPNNGSLSNLEIIKEFCIPIEIFVCTTISTITIDFLHPISSTNKILIGGGSFIDGIIILPIFIIFITFFIVTTTFLVILLIIEE